MEKDGGIESRAFELLGARLAAGSSTMILSRLSKSWSSSAEDSEAGELETCETAGEFDRSEREPNDSDTNNVGESEHDESGRKDDVDAFAGEDESESEAGKDLFERTQGAGSRVFEESRSDTVLGNGKDEGGSEYIEKISSKSDTRSAGFRVVEDLAGSNESTRADLFGLKIGESTRDREGVNRGDDSTRGAGEPGGDENNSDRSEGRSFDESETEGLGGSKPRQEGAVGYDEVRGWGHRGRSEARNV